MHEKAKSLLAIGIVALCSFGVLGSGYLLIHQIADARLEDSGPSPFQMVLPQAISFAPLECGALVVHEAKDVNGEVVGLAFTAVADGFCGPIEVMVALDPHSGRVMKVEIISQTETPGLGDRITAPEFTDQFSGKLVDDFKQIDAISGATVSSQAVAEIVDSSVRQVLAAYRGES